MYNQIRYANGQIQINLRLNIQFTPWSPQVATVDIEEEDFLTAA